MLSAAISEGRPGFMPLELSIIAGGTARMTIPELAKSRKELMQLLPKSLSPQLLRYSDEQTLASLVAISEAVPSVNLTNNDFHDWAIVSSSRSLGRSAFAAVIDKYQDEGPWGVSVHIIPHCTSHSVAGTISLALQSHGPCIAAGAAGNDELDALLAAACILRQPDLFGAWIVFSAWSPELAIDKTGRPISESLCLAAAIAVTREWSACSIGRICFDSSHSPNVDPSRYGKPSALSVGFIEFLTSSDGAERMWTNPPTRAIRIHVELNGSSWCESKHRSPANRKTNSEKLRSHIDSSEDFAVAPYRTH